MLLNLPAGSPPRFFETDILYVLTRQDYLYTYPEFIELAGDIWIIPPSYIKQLINNGIEQIGTSLIVLKSNIYSFYSPLPK